MKGCSIYKTKKEYKIITMYRLESWSYILSRPIFILPLEIEKEELSKKIYSCLEFSRSISEAEEDSFDIDLLKEIKERSYNTLYKNSTSCNIFLENNVIEIEPQKYMGKNLGVETDAERVLKLDGGINKLCFVEKVENILKGV